MKNYLLLILLALSACTARLPDKSTENYQQAVSAFYVGLAALEVGDDQRAQKELGKAAELAPGEPAVWNNLGVLQLRQKDFENSAQSLKRAKDLESNNALIYSNLAVLETQRGNFEAAIEYLNKTIELNPKDIQAIYTLALEKERQTNEAEALALYKRISAEKPGNLAVKLEIARLSAKLNNAEMLKALIENVGENTQNWPEEAKEQFEDLKRSVRQNDLRQAATDITFLKNVLLRLPNFRSDLARIKPSETTLGEPFLKPITLPVPDFKPAEPDLALSFSPQVSENVKANFTKGIFLNGERSVIARSFEKETLIGEAVLPLGLAHSKSLTAFDFDYDYKNDLAIADDQGFRLFKQTNEGEFDDVTEGTKISGETLSSPYKGVWILDVDNEGDLDLFLAAKEGPPIVLQNNSDGTFTETKPFENAENISDFAYADLDEDGDSDAFLLDETGEVKYFANERGGLFRETELPSRLTDIAALAIGDINGDSRLDLVLVSKSGPILRVSVENDVGGFESETVAETPEDFCLAKEESCLALIADFDNNGANDILVSNTGKTKLLLRHNDGKFHAQQTVIDAAVSNFADLNSDGKLDLIGVDSNGQPAVFQNQSAKNYHWQILRPRAQKTEGDQRINTYGIGGEMEIRAGLLAQKQIINSPQVHFGLGELTNTDVVRVVWQNGYVQAEFDLQADQTVAAEQRLKGSCPHLFAWNGSEFAHVKDAPPWSPALGLKINAQDTYGILQTEEWFKIPGDALKPKDGFYELRITAEYWESFYIDNYQLVAVEHPENTEVFTDERFAIPLPPLKVYTTGKTNPFAGATDHNGRDVLETVSTLDEKYLDSIKRGKFQGVAEDHFVELELPENAPRDKGLWLIADGWVHPTDASINVQRGQGNPNPPQSLKIEIEDENGVWKAVRENLGFPAGKMKTILLDLTDVFPKNVRRRLRLRTEMEIFWDKLAWASDLEGTENKTRPLGLSEATLRYRGFSVIEKPDDSSPEVPVYDKIMTTGQRWRDLEGFYTRFGDVRELLVKTDDRYVLANAGDELILKFPALPDVEKGWKRDFVIIGNGWIKDGDLNSVFSKTLLPLPTQATNDYTRRPTQLEDDPVYQQNRSDWLKFHTRFVRADDFRTALR